jgi:hypothetical protein
MSLFSTAKEAAISATMGNTHSEFYKWLAEFGLGAIVSAPAVWEWGAMTVDELRTSLDGIAGNLDVHIVIPDDSFIDEQRSKIGNRPRTTWVECAVKVALKSPKIMDDSGRVAPAGSSIFLICW